MKTTRWWHRPTLRATDDTIFQEYPQANTALKSSSMGFQKNVIAGVNIGPGENPFNTQLHVGAATETVKVSR